MDFAMKRGVSLSTLRRHIKAKKIRFKSENGRYLIWDEESSEEKVRWAGSSSSIVSEMETLATARNVRKIEELEQKLLRTQEENAELKMLVALYEEQLFSKKASSHL